MSHACCDWFVFYLKDDEIVHHLVYAVEHIENRTKAGDTAGCVHVQAVLTWPQRDTSNGHAGNPTAHHSVTLAHQSNVLEVPDSALDGETQYSECNSVLFT